MVPSSKRKFYFSPSIPCQFWDKYFLVAHFLHTSRVPAFCHRDRKPQTSMVRKYLGGRSEQFKNCRLTATDISFFFTLDSKALPWILASSEMHWKDISHMLSSFHLFYSRDSWHPTPVLLPGKSHGQRSLVGCCPWGHEESDTTERLHFHFSLSCIGEGNGDPLQCSCLENPRDGRAWWAAVYGVAQSRTRLKWLSSSRDSLWNAVYLALFSTQFEQKFSLMLIST